MSKVKIVWAVDPFDRDSQPEKYRESITRVLEANPEAEVHPVYVMSPEQLGLGFEIGEPQKENYLPAANRALESALQQSGILSGKFETAAPLVLSHHRPSVKGSVQALSRYAENIGADAIVVGSESRKGIDRVVLGSFAGTLLWYSKVPVIVAGAHAHELSPKKQGEPVRLLVPSDSFDPESRFFKSLLSFATLVRAKVTLLHIVPRPLEGFFQNGVYLLSGAWISIPAYLEQEHGRQKEKAAALAEVARKLGVDCEVRVDSHSGSVLEGILAAQKETGANWIALATETSPAGAALLGSVTREVVRRAECPVWVGHN